MDKNGNKLTPAKICSKIYRVSYDHFVYLKEIRNLMLKAFTVNLEHQEYQDLLEIKDKAAAAIKIKSYKFSTQLKDYDCQLSAFMESLDDTMFNDCISDCGERSILSVFDDEKCTIIQGWFWVYLIKRLQNQIEENKRLKEFKELKELKERKDREERKRQKELKELKEQEERREEKRRQNELKEAIKQAEIKRKKDDEFAKQKEAEFAKKIKEEKENKVKEEKQKRIDEENQNFENNIIKKIKENKSNTDKKLMTNCLKIFYYLYKKHDRIKLDREKTEIQRLLVNDSLEKYEKLKDLPNKLMMKIYREDKDLYFTIFNCSVFPISTHASKFKNKLISWFIGRFDEKYCELLEDIKSKSKIKEVINADKVDKKKKKRPSKIMI